MLSTIEFKTQDIHFICDLSTCMESYPCQHDITLNGEHHIWNATKIINFLKRHDQIVPDHFQEYELDEEFDMAMIR